MNGLKRLVGLALSCGMGVVGYGQAVPLQIDAVKKSGSKSDLGSQRLLRGSAETEAKEKFYEIRVRSMSPTIDRVKLEYLVVKEDRGGNERPGKYEKALISTPIGQMITMETESVALLETKLDPNRRRVRSNTFEEELVGIIVVAKTPEGKVLKEHFEPASRKKQLGEWLEKARKFKAQHGEGAVERRVEEGEQRRLEGPRKFPVRPRR